MFFYFSPTFVRFHPVNERAIKNYNRKLIIEKRFKM
jgi:hypothetical protein